MTLYRLGDTAPQLADDTVFVAPGAQVMGNVVLGSQSGIWFNAVLRGDNEPMKIGARSNIQDLTMIHSDPGAAVTIGEGCTIGHKAIIHGCTIGDNTLIGMGAIVLNRARIGSNCLIGAGALVTEGTEIPDGSLVVGAPGKVIRQLNENAIAALKMSAEHYLQNAARFMKDLAAID